MRDSVEKRETSGLEDIDRVIHEPSRLAIMARLYVLDEADWLFLQRQTGLSVGNLASHLARLEDAGYVKSEKSFIERKPHTVIRMTDLGVRRLRSTDGRWGAGCP